MIDRSSCGQRVFGGCMGDGCDRPCSATIYIPASKTPAGLHILAVNRWTLIGILAVLIPVFIVAASVGLQRAERAHQQDQV